jgi:hypothetical protein
VIGFIKTFVYNLCYSQSIIALALIYPLHKSPGHAKSSQSSLVVSWQRIYSSLTVTTAHIKSCFRRLTPLYSFNSHSRSRLITCYIASGGPHGKYRLSTISRDVCHSAAQKCTSYCSTVGFCRNVFSDPLPSNGHGADHIENTSCNDFSIVACAYLRRCL